MKKSIKFCIFALLVALSLALAAGCVRGASAYEIAVRNGFVGTEKEWLATLKGANGLNGKDGEDYKAYDVRAIYDAAIESGEFEGTFSEFVAEYFSENPRGTSETIAKGLYSSCMIEARTSVGSQTGSAGSGVIYYVDKERGDALIITNFHVVYEAEATTANHISPEIYTYLYGNKLSSGMIPCKYLGGTTQYDLALLKVENSDIIRNSEIVSAFDFGDSDDLTLGETVYAIGNAEGDGISVTKGIIGVDSEEIQLWSDKLNRSFKMRVFRFDAAISPGNSGGGIFNAKGELLGICNAKTSDTKSDGMGYAIPANVIKSVVEKLYKDCDGETRFDLYKPMIGITIAESVSHAEYNAEKARVDIIADVYIGGVLESCLYKDRLRENDQIKFYSINGGEKIAVRRYYSTVDAVLGLGVGDTVTLYIVRGGTELEVPITITEQMMTLYE